MKLEMTLFFARQKADEIVSRLRPYCERIDVAGSIRRQNPVVRDIEIVCQPSVVNVTDLFGYVIETKPNDSFVSEIVKLGTITKGSPTGRYVQVQLEHEINLDLFIPEVSDYVRQLVIRTGSAEFSKKVAKQWSQMGWCGTQNGLRLKKECVHDEHKWNCVVSNPTLPPKWSSEQEFFEWLNMEYVLPEQRF